MISAGIHIKDVPDVIFIKTHIHGAKANSAVLGTEMNSIFTCLESKYNDGHRYILHYAIAREIYNIIKALENGESPERIEEFRNYVIKAPIYNSSIDIAEASQKLKRLLYKTYR